MPVAHHNAACDESALQASSEVKKVNLDREISMRRIPPLHPLANRPIFVSCGKSRRVAFTSVQRANVRECLSSASGSLELLGIDDEQVGATLSARALLPTAAAAWRRTG